MLSNNSENGVSTFIPQSHGSDNSLYFMQDTQEEDSKD